MVRGMGCLKMANEKRLIDANALIYDIQNKLWDYETVDGITATTVLKQTVTDIRNQPTVDAVEVVHSQWDTVFYERNGTLASYSHICPKCKYFYRDVHFKGYNYCPTCGAKMDGDGNADV